MPAAASAVLTPVERRVVLHAWLSTCIVAASTFPPSPSQAAQLLESFPPPAWLLDCRGPEGRQLGVLAAAVLAAPGCDIAASAQRLVEFAKGLARPPGAREEHCQSGLFGALFSIALRRCVRQAEGAVNSAIEDLIIEAQNVLEAAASSGYAALRRWAHAVVEVHASSAEPLVEWLCSRHSSRQGSAGAALPVNSNGDGAPSAQDDTAEARQVYAQGMALATRFRTAQSEALTAPKDEAVLWIADLSVLLMAPPTQVLSLHHRTATLGTLSPDGRNDPRPYGLFDFESIAADAAPHATIKSSAADVDAHTAKELEQLRTLDARKEALAPSWLHTAATLDQPAHEKALSRSGGVPPSAGTTAAAMRPSVKSEKRSECATSEGEHQIALRPSSLCSALLLLFQRGAAAASRAVAVGAPLLAYSVIMQLGNALLLANADVTHFALGPDGDSPEYHAGEAGAGSETPGSCLVSIGKEGFASGPQDGAKAGEGSAGGKIGKRADSKGAVRPSGPASGGPPNNRGGKTQQPLERKLPIALWTAAGVIAHACVEVLLLVLREYLRTVAKDALDVTNLEGL